MILLIRAGDNHAPSSGTDSGPSLDQREQSLYGMNSAQEKCSFTGLRLLRPRSGQIDAIGDYCDRLAKAKLSDTFGFLRGCSVEYRGGEEIFVLEQMPAKPLF